MAELHQRTVVRVHGYFNVYKKNGWVPEYQMEFWLYNPTPEQIEAKLNIIQRKLANESSYRMRDEKDRKIVCEAIYPVVHENSEFGYYGDKIMQYTVDQDGYLTNYLAKFM